MSLSRRQFLRGTAAAAAAWPVAVRAQRDAEQPYRLFAHGVASGDPLPNRIILWTRLTVPPTRSAIGPIEVRWTIAADERLRQVVARGVAEATPERDFTVKVDVADLQSGRTYFYAFEAAGEQSSVGRTRTLKQGDVERLRLAVVSCSNYPAGYFNVYRCVANRDDLDAVVHLGDYIYEFANGIYGDGAELDRVPVRPGEAVTLDDYRARYATYRSDIDLQEAHRLHPFIAVWDDHEIADNAWAGGAGTHTDAKGEWTARQAAAYRAYLEWLPVREPGGSGIQLYRRFQIGALADLVMLDTRGFRALQAGARDPGFGAPDRSMLGSTQESWLFDQLRASQQAGTRWRLIGQQILFAPITPPGLEPQTPDMWDGYPAARTRVFDFLEAERITDLAILTGDLHSSWALDVARHPWTAYNAETGAGSAGVELVTPAISSPPLFADPALKQRALLFQAVAPHVKYLDGERHGYVLLDVTRDRLQSEWHFVPSVTERSARESRGATLVCERGSSRLTPA